MIGVILGFLSIGYTYGGKLSDKNPDYKKLSYILLLGAVFTLYINLVRPFAILIAESVFRDFRIGSLFLAIFLFAPSSFTLGMIPTYSVRLKMKSIKNSGEMSVSFTLCQH